MKLILRPKCKKMRHWSLYLNVINKCVEFHVCGDSIVIEICYLGGHYVTGALNLVENIICYLPIQKRIQLTIG